MRGRRIDDERPQPQVVEQKVDIEILVAHRDAKLPTDEREPLAEFEQELFEMPNEFGFEFTFLEGFGEGEEVEDVRVFQRLLRQVRSRSRKDGGEVGNGFSVAGVCLGVDLDRESVVSAISKRVARHDRFIRTGPNTFALIPDPEDSK